MTKKLFALAAFAAAIVCSGQVAHATHGTQSIVDIIEGSGPGVYNGSILSTVDTADWYTFSAVNGANVNIAIPSASYDTTLTLYRAPSIPATGDLRSSYTQVAFDDNFGTGETIVSILTAGFYVIAVEEFGGSGGNYTLAISGNGISAISAVPEPGTLALLSMGGIGLAGGAIRRRRMRKAAV